jgi:hypothetical protein
MNRFEDAGMQRRILMAARDAWLARRGNPDGWGQRFDDFYRFFSQHWEKLDPQEAGEWLDEVLSAIESEPDEPTHSRIGGRIEFHSVRAVRWFEIFNVVRTLRPAHTERLTQANPELAHAIEIYPLGLASMTSQPGPAGPGQAGGGGCFIGSGGSAASLAAMMAAQRGNPSAVEQMLHEAHRAYLEDTNPDDPNLAPRVFWPSCVAYKVVVHWAAKQSGMAAQAVLEQIPDRDFQILATIELAAALLGLSHHGRRFSRRVPRSA